MKAALLRRWFPAAAAAAAALILIAAVSLFAWRSVPLLRFGHSLKYGEGVLLDQGRRVTGEPGLYPDFDKPPFLIDNYPPVYPLLVSLMPRTESSPFFGGRLISILSTLLSASMIALIIRQHAGGAAALLGAAAFLTAPEVNEFGVLARVDALALALALLGFHSTLGGSRRSRLLGAAAFFLCVYTRHSMLALAGCAYLLLLLREGWRSLLWPAGLLAAGIVAFLLGSLITSGGLYDHLIHFNVLPYSWQGATMKWLGGVWPWRLFLVVVALLFLRDPGMERGWRRGALSWGHLAIVAGALITLVPVGWRDLSGGHGPLLPPAAIPYLVAFHALVAAGALLTLALSRWSRIDGAPRREGAILLVAGLASATLIGREGSDVNYLFEHTAILCILSGWALSHRLPWVRVAAGLLLLVHLIANPIVFDRGRESRKERLEEISRRGAIVERLREIPGPILSDDPSLPAILGRPLEIQPFMYRQLAEAGLWDPQSLIHEIRERRYAAIVRVGNRTVAGFERGPDGGVRPYFGPWTFNRVRSLPMAVQEAIRKHYRWDGRTQAVEIVNPMYFQKTTVWVPRERGG